jgi:hypothetical protein
MITGIKIKNVLALWLIGLFSLVQVAAQDSGPVLDPTSNFDRYYSNNYQESVYLHLDKEYYLTGEFMKFKVYCLEKTTSQPSQLSIVAYVEVLDAKNQAHLQTRIELDEGTGYGEFYIPINLASGNYLVRAYTRWMRNYGTETFYHSMVQIINPFKKLGLKPESQIEEYLVDFFPAGGSLIHGVESKIVYHVKNGLGIPQNLHGRLMANDSIEVAELRPIKNGLGSFVFTPDLTNKYHVELDVEGEKVRQEFDEIESRGLSFQVENNDAELKLDIYCNDPSIIDPSANMHVALHQQGELLEYKSVRLLRGQAELSVKHRFQGVATISLIDQKGEVIAEKKMFMNNAAHNPSTILVQKDRFFTRDEVVISLPEMLTEDKQSKAHYSISVSATNPALIGHALDLDDYLVLGTELNYVYELNTYLQGSKEEVSRLVNNLLIAYPTSTNNHIFSDEDLITPLIPEHRSVLVTGRLTDQTKDEPAFNIMTYLSVPGKITQIYAAKSESDGRLILEAGNFYGSKEVIVQNDYTEDSVHSIEIDDPYSLEYADIPLPDFDLDESLENYIKSKSQQMQVYNANLKLSPNSEIVSLQDSASFYNEPDARYYLDDYTRFIVMEEVMREYIAGVNVRKNREGFHFMVIDMERNIIYQQNPLMLLDGVPVFDADDIIALDPLKIEKIETIKTRFGRGDLDCRGIVTYTSYAGDLAGYQLNKNALLFEYDGLQPIKQYIFPSYSTAYQRNNPTPDFRNSLYWNPQQQPTGDEITFYAGDVADTFMVKIEGITSDGTPFSFNDTFTVQPQEID